MVVDTTAELLLFLLLELLCGMTVAVAMTMATMPQIFESCYAGRHRARGEAYRLCVEQQFKPLVLNDNIRNRYWGCTHMEASRQLRRV